MSVEVDTQLSDVAKDEYATFIMDQIKTGTTTHLTISQGYATFATTGGILEMMIVMIPVSNLTPGWPLKKN